MLSLKIADLTVRFADLADPALTVPSLDVAAGARLAVTGASGSGKSTFINVITGLERPTTGRIVWDGVDIAALSETRRDRWRAANIGLVMQDFHLFPGLTAMDNILLPARLARAADTGLKARALELMGRVGLERPEQRIETMSRGEMQRVAVARALLRRPGVVIADEPTASLDVGSGEKVGAMLIALAQEERATLIVVTHDTRLAAGMQRHLQLEAGRVRSDDAIQEEPAI